MEAEGLEAERPEAEDLEAELLKTEFLDNHFSLDRLEHIDIDIDKIGIKDSVIQLGRIDQNSTEMPDVSKKSFINLNELDKIDSDFIFNEIQPRWMDHRDPSNVECFLVDKKIINVVNSNYVELFQSISIKRVFSEKSINIILKPHVKYIYINECLLDGLNVEIDSSSGLSIFITTSTINKINISAKGKNNTLSIIISNSTIRYATISSENKQANSKSTCPIKIYSDETNIDHIELNRLFLTEVKFKKTEIQTMSLFSVNQYSSTRIDSLRDFNIGIESSIFIENSKVSRLIMEKQKKPISHLSTFDIKRSIIHDALISKSYYFNSISISNSFICLQNSELNLNRIRIDESVINSGNQTKASQAIKVSTLSLNDYFSKLGTGVFKPIEETSSIDINSSFIGLFDFIISDTTVLSFLNIQSSVITNSIKIQSSHSIKQSTIDKLSIDAVMLRSKKEKDNQLSIDKIDINTLDLFNLKLCEPTSEYANLQISYDILDLQENTFKDQSESSEKFKKILTKIKSFPNSFVNKHISRSSLRIESSNFLHIENLDVSLPYINLIKSVLKSVNTDHEISIKTTRFRSIRAKIDGFRICTIPKDARLFNAVDVINGEISNSSIFQDENDIGLSQNISMLGSSIESLIISKHQGLSSKNSIYSINIENSAISMLKLEYIDSNSIFIEKSKINNNLSIKNVDAEIIDFDGSKIDVIDLENINRNTKKDQHNKIKLDNLSIKKININQCDFADVNIRRSEISELKTIELSTSDIKLWRIPERDGTKIIKSLDSPNKYKVYTVTSNMLASIEHADLKGEEITIENNTEQYDINIFKDPRNRALIMNPNESFDMFWLFGEDEYSEWEKSQITSKEKDEDIDNENPVISSQAQSKIIGHVIRFKDSDIKEDKISTDFHVASLFVEHISKQYSPTKIKLWTIERCKFKKSENELIIQKSEKHYNRLTEMNKTKLRNLVLRPVIDKLDIQITSIQNNTFNWLEFKDLSIEHSDLLGNSLENIVVHGNLYVRQSSVSGEMTFAHMKVIGMTELRDLIIKKDAKNTLDYSDFIGPIELNEIEITKSLSMSHATIHETLNLRDFALLDEEEISIDLSSSRFEESLSILLTHHLPDETTPSNSKRLKINLQDAHIVKELDLSQATSIEAPTTLILDKVNYTEMISRPLELDDFNTWNEPYQMDIQQVKKLTPQDYLRRAIFYKHLYLAAKNKNRIREWKYYHRSFIKNLNRSTFNSISMKTPIFFVFNLFKTMLQWYELDIYNANGQFGVMKMAAKALFLSVIFFCIHIGISSEITYNAAQDALLASTIKAWLGPLFGLLSIGVAGLDEMRGLLSQTIYGVHCVFNILLFAPILKSEYGISAPETIEMSLERAFDEKKKTHQNFILKQERDTRNQYIILTAILISICVEFTINVYHLVTAYTLMASMFAIQVSSIKEINKMSLKSIFESVLIVVFGSISFYGTFLGFYRFTAHEEISYNIISASNQVSILMIISAVIAAVATSFMILPSKKITKK